MGVRGTIWVRMWHTHTKRFFVINPSTPVHDPLHIHTCWEIRDGRFPDRQIFWVGNYNWQELIVHSFGYHHNVWLEKLYKRTTGGTPSLPPLLWSPMVAYSSTFTVTAVKTWTACFLCSSSRSYRWTPASGVLLSLWTTHTYWRRKDRPMTPLSWPRPEIPTLNLPLTWCRPSLEPNLQRGRRKHTGTLTSLHQAYTVSLNYSLNKIGGIGNGNIFYISSSSTPPERRKGKHYTSSASSSLRHHTIEGHHSTLFPTCLAQRHDDR